MARLLPSPAAAPGAAAVLLAAAFAAAGDVYQAPEDFLAGAFDGDVPDAATLWLDGPLQDSAKAILGHPYASLRVRYWRDGERTAWILEEIGKERPITTGYVIDAGRIERVKVLVFRESRGWEVRYPSFTSQFDGATLEGDGTPDRHIDGISGATLSVRALKKLARLALMLHAEVTRE